MSCLNGDVGSVAVNNNTIYGNTSYGIRNDSATTLNAENNWWGDASGPDDDANIINGSGDKISVNANTDPWSKAQQ